MEYIDVHAHLDFEQFDKDRDKIIEECKQKEVAVINCGVDIKSNRKVLQIADMKTVFPALGIYPLRALEMRREDITREIQFIRENKPIAIAEVGMDFHYCKDTDAQDEQRTNLSLFLELAEEMDIPIEIHSRGAEEETINLLSSYNAKIVMHCYSGKTDNLPEYYYSIPSMILKSKKFRKLVKKIPNDKLLTETDAPYLSPEGDRNVPWSIIRSIPKIAEIKKISEEDMREQILKNTRDLFRI